MVRNYVKKGGHGGARTSAGLPPGFWEDQGGRKAAAEAKVAGAKAKAADAAASKRSWEQMGCTFSKQEKVQPNKVQLVLPAVAGAAFAPCTSSAADGAGGSDGSDGGNGVAVAEVGLRTAADEDVGEGTGGGRLENGDGDGRGGEGEGRGDGSGCSGEDDQEGEGGDSESGGGLYGGDV